MDRRGQDSQLEVSEVTLRELVALMLAGFAVACGGEEAPSLRLEPIATLGDTSGPGMFVAEPFSIARTLDGRYLVGVYDNELVRLFDSTGAYLTSIGQIGPGPREYISPSLVTVHDDGSIIIMDNPGGTRTELAADLSFRRRDRLGGQALWFAGLLSDGSYVLNRPVSLPGGGSSIRRFGRDGSPLDDYEEPAFQCSDPNECMWHSPRIFDGDASGGLWAARPAAWPAVFRYDRDGNLQREFDLRLGWLPAGRPQQGGSYPMLSSMRVDNRGRLWLAGTAPTPAASGDASSTSRTGHVAVLDSISGAPIAEASVPDAHLLHLLRENVVAVTSEDSLGFYHVRLYRALLSGGS